MWGEWVSGGGVVKEVGMEKEVVREILEGLWEEGKIIGVEGIVEMRK